MMVNGFCNIINLAAFNRSALSELQEQGNLTIESKDKNPLEGYSVTMVYVEFIDFEDKSKIADCTSTKLARDLNDIEFNAYRSYEYSFFGMEIGKPVKF